MSQNPIPVLPDSAPFTPEQRAYLNGFLAGLFSRAVVGAAPAASAPASKPLTPLSILFGSQTGNCESLAKRIAREAGQRGFAPTIHDLAKYPVVQLASEQSLLLITSTYGDGEPPDNAKAFWEFLSDPGAPKLASSRFSVCALGDTNYAKFCGFGKDVDGALEKLGAVRVFPRADCDVDYEEPFAKWLDGALISLAGAANPLTPALSPSEGERENRSPSSSATASVGGPAILETRASGPLLSPLSLGGGEGQGEEAGLGYGKKNPFPSPLLANIKLNAEGSAKDTRHFAFSLEGSGLAYEVGDALCVRPTNCAELAEEILRVLGCSGEEGVPDRDGKDVSLREALLHHYEITRIPSPFLKALAEKAGDAGLKVLTGPTVNGELTKFLYGREIIDLLHAHPEAKFAAKEFVALLKKLQPRLYSISSSPKAHPGEVQLCVGVVRYDSLGRPRKGVCSTFLAERVPAGGVVPVFTHTNKAFRPPASGDTPMIMVGPGTGIAPFRGFLEERRATGAKGKNWLFFGEQKSSMDFLFREQIESFRNDGLLTRLDLAWSRDQGEKVYVQHRMLEHARELWNWLEQGGAFYVCGDASRMAKDVDAALHQVIERAGERTPEQAAEYVKQLKSAKRYQRDVY